LVGLRVAGLELEVELEVEFESDFDMTLIFVQHPQGEIHLGTIRCILSHSISDSRPSQGTLSIVDAVIVCVPAMHISLWKFDCACIVGS